MTSDSGGRRPETDHPEEMWVKKEFALLRHHLQQLPLESRAKLQSSFQETLATDTVTIESPRGPISFVLFGKTSGGRATSLLTKQPATIAWIDRFQPGGVFWDIGANVGVYTLYAARRGDTRVVAIEPAAVNYFLLSANCEANRLDDQVEALLLGLGRERAVARLNVSQFSAAESFSFKVRDADPRPGRQAALILSMDALVEDFQVACPNYLKIDTPGMSEAVLEGGARTLMRSEVRELHVELRTESKSGQRLVKMLAGYGFAIESRDAHGSADVTFVRS